MTTKGSDLQDLKERIRRLERGGAAAMAGTLSLGIPNLDGALPDGGLPLGAVHSIAADPSQADHGGAALGFVAYLAGAIARRQQRPVLWITPQRNLYAPALARLGLTPKDLFVLCGADDDRALWAAEQALRCAALATAVVEVKSLSPVAARRLQLAAEAAGVTGLVIQQDADAAPLGTLSHWRIAGAPSPGDKTDLARQVCWSVALCRVRGGRPAEARVMCRMEGAVPALACAADQFVERSESVARRASFQR